MLARAEQRPEVAQWSPRDVIERALARVAETKAGVVALGSDAGDERCAARASGVGTEQIRPLLEGLTDEALDSAVLVSLEESTEDTAR